VEVRAVADIAHPANAEHITVGARTHDEFRSVFTAAYAPVVRTVWLVVHDRAAAEDIAQDAFVELYRHWRKVCRYERPDLWVRRVALRRAQREAMRTVRRTELERARAAVERDEGVGEPVLPDPRVLEASRDLTPRQRAIVVLFYLEDRPMTEVADLVGCSVSTGFVHLHHARHRLAQALGEEVDGHVR
jgi:RNA polymerase sigma-70 factor (ECF subfamily)